VRPSCALPYELYAEGKADKKQVTFTMQAGNKMHGKKAAGAPFTVYAPGQYKDEKGTVDVCRNWAFAVKPGDSLTYQWPLAAFENNRYHLRLYGPNGFYREVMGNAGDPALQIAVAYEQDAKTQKPTGNVIIKVRNDAAGAVQVAVKDHAYKTNDATKTVAKGDAANIVLPLKNSHGWYDFSITINGFDAFEKRYAGRVETGAESFSDPFMGRV
jgi:phospholipase C